MHKGSFLSRPSWNCRRIKNAENISGLSFYWPYKIFYNFECINEKGFSHQIDALIITTRFLLVVEVKQISSSPVKLRRGF
ncbi:nuclease-related domain-containing protein [Solibacillus silvestris]